MIITLISTNLPSGQIHAESAGNPWGWWILGGGESPEKFGLSVKRESTGKLRGNFRVDSPGIFQRFPAEFKGIFGGFIGDKIVADFKENPQRFSREIMYNLQRIQGEI